MELSPSPAVPEEGADRDTHKVNCLGRADPNWGYNPVIAIPAVFTLTFWDVRPLRTWHRVRNFQHQSPPARFKLWSSQLNWHVRCCIRQDLILLRKWTMMSSWRLGVVKDHRSFILLSQRGKGVVGSWWPLKRGDGWGKPKWISKPYAAFAILFS